MDLVEPKKLNYLNFDKNIQEKAVDFFPNFTVALDISSEVTIQKRIVYDYFKMFGAVGGLNDFIIIIFGTFLRYISSTRMERTLV